jgi:hypothetical protein
MRSLMTTFSWVALLLLVPRLGEAAGAAQKQKYYFNIAEVRAAASVDEATKTVARDALQTELARRPEFTSELGGVSGEEAVIAELKRRGLQGFLVTLKIEALDRERKPPQPGSRLPQIGINVKLSVFGTTLPGAKLAFGGEGEAGIQGEVPESRIEAESASMIKDAMAQAVKQAVDQAVAKLSLPRAKPMNENRRKKKA